MFFGPQCISISLSGINYLVVVHTLVAVGTAAGTAAVDIPAVHTAAAGTAALDTTAGQHTEAAVGTVAVEDKRKAVVVVEVDSRLLEVEDKQAEAGENQTAVDKVMDLEPVPDIRSCKEEVVLKLKIITTWKLTRVNSYYKQQIYLLLILLLRLLPVL